MSIEARSGENRVSLSRLSDRSRVVILCVLAAALVAAFMVVGAKGLWEYVLPRRAIRVLAMTLSGTAIATSTIIFQAITHNRILSPSIMGLDALYVLTQTAIIFVFGSAHPVVHSTSLSFGISLAVMIGFSGLMYRMFFTEKAQHNLFLMLLLGIVFGTFFQSAASLLQVIIDPNEFLLVQDRMFASFNNIKTELLTVAGVAIVGTLLFLRPYVKYLDVLALGRDHAVNLGVDYPKVVRQLLMAVFALVSISTALVGPVTFLGLIVANVAYELLQTYARKALLVAASLVSVIALIGGQLLVEHVFNFSTTLSVIINFAGGMYFLYLIIKERTAW